MALTVEPPGIAQAKAQLRRDTRDARALFVASMSAGERAIAFRTLPSPLVSRIAPGATIALYHARGDEAPTSAIIEQLDRLGYPLALPVTDRLTGALRFARWQPDEILVPGPFHMLQPASDAPDARPDVFIAPLVAFDSALNRLGQGGGYYDRAFALWPNALRIGLGWSVQQIDAVPVEPTDVPLHIVLTERAVIER